MTQVLVTGGAGFIGSHFIEHALVNTDWDLVCLDSLTYASVLHPLMESDHYREHADRVRFLWHDLRAPLEPVANALRDVTMVYHFASGSHVERSLAAPVPFIHNNVMGTLNLLEWARSKVGLLTHFFHVSTDEVYGPVPEKEYSLEWDPIVPSNPYAASKASQEAMAISYWRSYGVPLVITNTMNNYGERQHPEKFIPLVIHRLLRGLTVEVHGSYRQEPGGRRFSPGSRHWLHARNHADALVFLSNILPVLHGGTPQRRPRPDRYNVAGEERNNWDLAVLLRQILEALGHDVRGKLEPVDFHRSRPGHDLRYALNGAKLAQMGWSPPVSLDDSLVETVEWFTRH